MSPVTVNPVAPSPRVAAPLLLIVPTTVNYASGVEDGNSRQIATLYCSGK